MFNLNFIPINTLFLIAFISFSSLAEEFETIENYVAIGLESNVALRQKQRDYQNSLLALKIARGKFLPTVSIESRHSRGGGGRTFEVPTGDLLNPVHATLNQLMDLNPVTTTPGGFPAQPRFSTAIENDIFRVIRKEDHESKLTFGFPLYNPAIYHDVQSKRKSARSQYSNLQTFKEQLKYDIKIACYNFVKTGLLNKLVSDSIGLVQENYEMSMELVKFGRATEETIFRAKSEISKVELEATEAKFRHERAKNYLNFLVNRTLNSSVLLELKLPNFVDPKDIPQIAPDESVSNRRWEITSLTNRISALDHSIRVFKSRFKPDLSGQFEVGYEGENSNYFKDDEFWRATMFLKWNIFRGNRDKHEIKRLELTRLNLKDELNELSKHIELEYLEILTALKVHSHRIRSFEMQLESSRQTLDVIREKYQHGRVTQIEFLEARSDFSNAGVNLIISQYDYTAQYADLERIALVNHTNID